MKSGIKEIIGKSISGVVVKERAAAADKGHVQSMVFLLFEDGTHYELYAPLTNIQGIGGVRTGDKEWVESYVCGEMKIVFEAHRKSVMSLEDYATEHSKTQVEVVDPQEAAEELEAEFRERGSEEIE